MDKANSKNSSRICPQCGNNVRKIWLERRVKWTCNRCGWTKFKDVVPKGG